MWLCRSGVAAAAIAAVQNWGGCCGYCGCADLGWLLRLVWLCRSGVAAAAAVAVWIRFGCCAKARVWECCGLGLLHAWGIMWNGTTEEVVLGGVGSFCAEGWWCNRLVSLVLLEVQVVQVLIIRVWPRVCEEVGGNRIHLARVCCRCRSCFTFSYRRPRSSAQKIWHCMI